MALKKCRECGHSISTKAEKCPSCGAPQKQQPGILATGCGCLTLIFIAFIIIGALSSGRNNSTPAARNTTTQPIARETVTAVTPAIQQPEQKSAQELAAETQAKNEETKQKLSKFIKVLETAGIDNEIITNVVVRDHTATIKVTNLWHLMAYQIRLQSAQNLWNLWAAIDSPQDVDLARISIVDLNGNEVGGSRFLAGSLIWVQEK